MLVNQKPIYRTLSEKEYEAIAGSDWPLYSQFITGQPIAKFIAIELDAILGKVSQTREQTSNFCASPFFYHEYPGNTHCCLLPQTTDILKVRKDLLANQRPQECNACWILEDAGIISERQIKNQTVDFYSDTDIISLYKQAESQDFKTTHYKINAGNYCNATCVTCDSGSSTAWGQLLEKDKKIIPVMLNADISFVDINYESAEFIMFTGGESTMIRTHWDILEKLIQTGNTNCGVSFVTNGSFRLTSKQQEILSKLKSVVFCFSIDGVGPVFEYLRYPLSWNQINENIRWVREQNFMISVSYTISNLNILYHEQTLAWLNQNKLPYLENIVYDPVHFSPKSLNQTIKNQILKSLNDPTSQTFLSNHSESDEANYRQFLLEIEKQDNLKNISIKDYLPEFANLIYQ
jgi:hypothetical protein